MSEKPTIFLKLFIALTLTFSITTINNTNVYADDTLENKQEVQTETEPEKNSETTPVPEQAVEKGTVEYAAYDENNNLIANTNKTISGDVDTAYKLDATLSTVPSNYEFVKVEGAIEGTYTKDTIQVKYIYKKILSEGSITIKYIDYATKKAIATDEVIKGKESETKAITAKSIDNYTFYKDKSSSLNVTFNSGNIDVNLYYVSNDYQAKVIVNYLDKNSNKVIKPFKEITGKISEKYNIYIPDVSGYYFNGNNGSLINKFTYEVMSVTLYYTTDYDAAHTGPNVGRDATIPNYQIGNFYVDIATGKDIYPADIYTYTKGDGVTSTAMELDDYTLLPEYTQGDTVLTVTKDEDVTFYYKANNEITPPTKTPEEVQNERATKTIVKYVEYYTKSAIAPEIRIEESEEAASLAESKDINGYTFIDTTNEDTADQKVIVKRYKKNTFLTVNYVDENQNVIQDATKTNGYVNDEYTVKAATIAGYTLTSAKDSITSKYVDKKEGSSETFVYKKDDNIGTVNVKYVYYKDNSEIAQAKTFSGAIDSEYNIPKNNITGYTFIYTKDDAKLKGKYTTDSKEITLLYAKFPKVTINYVDEQKNAIANQKVTIYDKQEDQNSYITEKALDIDGYEIADNNKSYSILIPVNDQEVTKTFTYKKIKAAPTITSKFVDEQGNKLREDRVNTQAAGSKYNEVGLTIDGYTIDDKDRYQSGVLKEDSIILTFVYKKEIKTGSATINYLDLKTGEVLAKQEILKGNAGQEYTVEAKEIPNYQVFSPDKATEEKYTYTAHFQPYTDSIINVYYQKEITLTIKYEDQDGIEIADSKKVIGVKDDMYTEVPIDIDSYVAEKANTKTVGVFVDNDIELIFVYKQKATSTIKYIDTLTKKEISKDVVLNGFVNESYTAKAKNISGYVLATSNDQVSEVFTKNDNQVVFEYSKISNEESSKVDTNNKTDKKQDEKGQKTATAKTLLPVTGNITFIVSGLLVAIAIVISCIKKIKE
ncbi:MucBP domain-containing protein [Mycoplasma sp. P36-A1]|uniref:MucBP domain-containing protein n=1 Tax=Mycoplasma sp. P36-A1 TaxID=3252900 RepID=UPI003C2C57A0